MRPVSRSRCAPAAVLLAALGACQFDGGGLSDDDDDHDGGGGDAGIDGVPVDAACGGGSLSFLPSNVARCAIPVAFGDFAFPEAKITIDTTDATVSTPSGPISGLAIALVTQTDGETPAMVVVANDLFVPVGVEVRVTGSRPLILVALADMTIDGTIDASGAAEQTGPGAGLACETGAGTDGAMQLDLNGNPGGAGGGGGAYGSDGGSGAYVSIVVDDPQRTPGGTAWGIPTIAPLFGGCSGGAGGIVEGDAARGGGGGGGLQLISGGTMTIRGVVTASGGGGEGADAQYGGGAGGGSGGAILINAMSVTLDGAALTANGGGGGEGRRNTQNGEDGDDGSRTDAIPAAGGGPNAAGGDGGEGGVDLGIGSDGSAGLGDTGNAAGGGGGGGGIGQIHIRASAMSFQGELVSPPASSSEL
jgi:hypothetical protein